MPKVRLAGEIEGHRDPNRKVRAKLLYNLFEAGWDIYNANGDQTITLSNIQNKIIESDAFVFLPGPNLQDMFKAASVFVGYQTNDEDLEGKSTVMLNSDYSWDKFINLINHLHELGTVKQTPEMFLDVVSRPREVLGKLQEIYTRPEREKHPEIDLDDDFEIQGKAKQPDYSVCVFCSASIKKQPYLDDGYNLGKMLADNDYGCVSGAGSTGIMGQIVKGCGENGGWAAGSNVPHIIRMEGLPKMLSEFWPRDDIYTRMEIMIEKSDAFVIMPGGIGSVQEMMALMVLKDQQHPSVVGKPIIVINRKDEDTGLKFWSPFIRMLNSYGAYDYYSVVDTIEQVIPKIEKLRKNKELY